LLEFLAFCFDECESVSIWTAASEGWMRGIIETFPSQIRDRFLFTWSYDRLTRRQVGLMPTSGWVTEKPLIKMWRVRPAKDAGMTKHNTIIVEDTPSKCFKNYGNAVYVDSYGGAAGDDTLARLVLYLRDLADVLDECETVRATEKRGWAARYSSSPAAAPSVAEEPSADE
jgi:RNA polymerase II subunit A small phosphatase-like protein